MAGLASIRPPGGTLSLMAHRAPSPRSNLPRLVTYAARMLVGAALRFVRLGILVLFASCVSAWLLGCAATSAHTQAWAQTTPNGMRLFRICRRHPHVDPNARYWYGVGDGTPRTTFLPLDELLEGREAKAVYIHDPHAPSESRKLLGIAFQHLPCDKPPPPRRRRSRRRRARGFWSSGPAGNRPSWRADRARSRRPRPSIRVRCPRAKYGSMRIGGKPRRRPRCSTEPRSASRALAMPGTRTFSRRAGRSPPGRTMGSRCRREVARRRRRRSRRGRGPSGSQTARSRTARLRGKRHPRTRARRRTRGACRIRTAGRVGRRIRTRWRKSRPT